MLNLQSYWQPTGGNFGAPKNMGGLCFQVLGSLGVLGVFVFKTPLKKGLSGEAKKIKKLADVNVRLGVINALTL